MFEFNLEQKLDALNYLDAGVDRDTWHRIGRAAIAAGLTVEQIDTWSSTAGNYAGARDVASAFRTIKADGKTGPGTLIWLAKESGWTPLADDDQRPAKPPPRAAEPPRKPAPGMSAAEVWERCIPATNAHSYIQAKGAAGVPLDGLRVVRDGDSLRIAGESMAGALAVPCWAADGSLSTLQFITTGATADRLKAARKPTKLNLPGHSVQGWFIVGKIEPGAPVYLTEGIGTAWACWMATGAAAVVAFGWGNVSKVATALRQRDVSARLVICPDVGKEADAEKIAAEVGAAVAKMPEGWPANSDLNDLFQSPDGGFDAVQQVLEAAVAPPKPEPKIHPLALYVDFGDVPAPPRWVIPGFIADGVSVISGSPGVGKTTALLPLALTAAGIHGQDDLMPRHWRHVVYVTEDIDQAKRIIAGLVGYGCLGIDIGAVRERFHLVSAVRLDAQFVASVGDTYREQFIRNVAGVEILPLVVIDTKSAVIALENENDNSEASRMMAALKQGFARLPVWLVGHVAKASMGRSDVPALSNRGAGATDGDGNATLFLIQEGDCRYLVLGKKRFEPKWAELEIIGNTASTVVLDEFGYPEDLTMRWGIAVPAQTSRREAADKAAELQRQQDDAAMRGDILDVVGMAWGQGNPLNRAGVKAKVRRKTTDVVACIEILLNERWLIEVDVPAKLRTNNNRAAFLVSLTTEEHEAVIDGADLPADKLVIPQSWQKPPIPSVPAPEGEVLEESL